MLKFISILNNTEFRSSTRTTPEFLSFYRTFMADMKRTLKPRITAFEMHKGHFYAYGFFRTNSNRMFYFSISDVRYFPESSMLIRTVKDFRDFTGGCNQYVKMDNDFEQNLMKLLDFHEPM